MTPRSPEGNDRPPVEPFSGAIPVSVTVEDLEPPGAERAPGDNTGDNRKGETS
jgi:hypothetical protein